MKYQVIFWLPYFKNPMLLVTVRGVGGRETRVLPGLVGPTSCHVEMPSSHVGRLIEDIVVDIGIGTFLRASGPVADLVSMHGLDALYRAKAAFARMLPTTTWDGMVSRDATYVPFSFLNKVPDDDISGRAAAAFEIWRDFSDSLGVGSAVPRGSRRAGRDELSKIPKIGGQLPIRRIRSAAAALPDGEYLLAVLRRSTRARRSQAYRGAMAAIFGARARTNSFRLLPLVSFTPARSILAKFQKSGHVFIARVVVKAGVVLLGPTSEDQ